MTSFQSLAVTTALAVAAIGGTASKAAAQSAAATPAPAASTSAGSQSPSTPASGAITAGWQDGFVLQSPNGDNRLLIGATIQTDGRFSLDDPTPIVNTFTIRKLRPTLSGRVAKYFDFKVMPDFGSGTATLVDAYFDVRFSSAFRIRSGKTKTPIGYELLTSDDSLLFPERALASSLVPNRDTGIQAQGDLAGGKFSYAGGVFNGIPDGSSASTDVDTNNGKDLAGRLVVQPFKAGTGSTPLSGFGVQLGGSTGKETGALPSFKTSVGQTYFSYGSTITASGEHNRVTPAVFYYYKSFGAFGEYVRSTQDVAKGTTVSDVTNQAWEISGSFVLTGEAASDRGVKPRHQFDPQNGKWGALQLVARYAKLKVDSSIFTNSLAAANASPDAKSFTIGANWYPASIVKYYLTYEHTVFGTNATSSRPAENVILFRTQVAF